MQDGISHVEQAVSCYQADQDPEGATRAQVDLGLALKDACDSARPRCTWPPPSRRPGRAWKR